MKKESRCLMKPAARSQRSVGHVENERQTERPTDRKTNDKQTV